MSYLGQTRPISIVSYPLDSVIGRGGAPRYALIERDQGVVIESDRVQPLSVGGVTFENRNRQVPGNVLSPGLPFYLRNSLLDLDTYQTKAQDLKSEAELYELQQEMAIAAKEAAKRAEEYEAMQEKKWGIYDYMTLGGVGVATAALIFYFVRKK